MRERGLQHERLTLMWIAIYCGVAILAVRLLHVQVIRNVYYSRVAERNRTQLIPQAAPRGRIYDRNGVVIATNRPTFSLIYLPGETKDIGRLRVLARSLAGEVHQDEEAILGLLKEAQREESAIHLAENLPLKAMFKLSELKTIYPGVDLIVEARRHYPNKNLAAHLLGYMGRMNKRNWKKLRNRGYRVDSWIGISGIEKLFEDELRGVDGQIRMEVDAQGRLRRKLGHVPWRQGANVHLTLDTKIQMALEEGLRSSPTGVGGGVVIDPRNGEILAMASAPDFDPNLFLLPEWDEAKRALKNFPAFNRAISGTYAPGSTFKIVVGAAMFEEEKVDPEDKVYCPGWFRLGNRTFKCWEKRGHKKVDWMGGITHSCDVYFYTQGLVAGGRLIEAYAKKFGFGRSTRVGLSGEKGGNLFGPESRKKRAWYRGDTVNQSIGQGGWLATPMQMAVIIAAVANEGVLWRPRFTDRIERGDGGIVYRQKPEVLGRLEFKAETWKLIHDGLFSVVKNGTGRRVNIRGLHVAGKTGTSQNPLGEDHAWFIAFAGKEGEAASVAVSVLVEHGGHGSSAAGPIARKVIETAFGMAKPKRRRPRPKLVPEAVAAQAPVVSTGTPTAVVVSTAAQTGPGVAP